MARVEFMNAIYRGKIGASVYAYNKAGSYVRQYRTPTNPNTQAQQDARNEFSSVTKAWHSLTDEQKAAWNTFADNIFAPKHPVTGMRYSGFNAFVSLQNASNNANRLARTTAVKDDGDVSVTPVFSSFIPTYDAPINTLSPYIQKADGSQLRLTLGNVVFTSDANLTWSFTFDKQTDEPKFQDATGSQPVGYVVYISNALQQGQQFIYKPELTIGGVSKIIDSMTWPVAGTDELKFSMTGTDFAIENHKMWYQVGETVRITHYAVSVGGQMAVVGSNTVEVT